MLIRQEKPRDACIKFVSSLFIGPNVHDAVREGHRMRSNMEDYNDASAMAAPGNTPTIRWMGNNSPAQENCPGLDMYRHHTVCLCTCVCMCEIKNIRPDEKTHKKYFQFHKCKRVLSCFSFGNINSFFFLYLSIHGLSTLKQSETRRRFGQIQKIG